MFAKICFICAFVRLSAEIFRETSQFLDLNVLLDEIQQQKSHQNLVDFAKRHNFNMSHVHVVRDKINHTAKGIEIFYNNGQTKTDAVLDLKNFDDDYVQDFIEKAREQGYEAYVSQEKYSDEGEIIESHLYGDNKKFSYVYGEVDGVFLSNYEDFFEEIRTYFDQVSRLRQVNYLESGEIENVYQNDHVPPQIYAFDESNDERPDVLIYLVYALKHNYIWKLPEDERAEALRKILEEKVGVYDWLVMINVVGFVADYDVRIGFNVDGDDVVCLGRLKK